MPIDESTWQKHIDDDAVQTAHIAELRMAMYGDARYPETVKSAIVPTQQRINTWLDSMRWVIGIVVSFLIITAPLWVWLIRLALKELAEGNSVVAFVYRMWR